MPGLPEAHGVCRLDTINSLCVHKEMVSSTFCLETQGHLGLTHVSLFSPDSWFGEAVSSLLIMTRNVTGSSTKVSGNWYQLQ